MGILKCEIWFCMKVSYKKILRDGGVGVLATDTIYGILGQALRPKTVERIYEAKGRNPKKPFIILISSINDLELFKIKLNIETLEFLKKIWPDKVSVILPAGDPIFKYLHRGTKKLAFRMPKNKKLISLVSEISPLVAPSANPEGEKPAGNIQEAKKYFGDKIDFYEDAGELDSLPSTLVKIDNGAIYILREREVKIKS